LLIVGNVEAKIRVGLKGGFNFASLSADNISFDNRTGWHAGAMMNIGLPFGLSIQPELLYNSRGANLNITPSDIWPAIVVPTDASISYIEIPVDLQWGIKLPLLRPYLSLTPYASYMISSDVSMDNIKNWDAGIGLGAGIDVWKLQLSVKYLWGFGNLSESPYSIKNRNVMLSLGIFL
jgi:hypothetical protein